MELRWTGNFKFTPFLIFIEKFRIFLLLRFLISSLYGYPYCLDSTLMWI